MPRGALFRFPLKITKGTLTIELSDSHFSTIVFLRCDFTNLPILNDLILHLQLNHLNTEHTQQQ